MDTTLQMHYFVLRIKQFRHVIRTEILHILEDVLGMTTICTLKLLIFPKWLKWLGWFFLSLVYIKPHLESTLNNICHQNQIPSLFIIKPNLLRTSSPSNLISSQRLFPSLVKVMPYIWPTSSPISGQHQISSLASVKPHLWPTSSLISGQHQAPSLSNIKPLLLPTTSSVSGQY